MGPGADVYGSLYESHHLWVSTTERSVGVIVTWVLPPVAWGCLLRERNIDNDARACSRPTVNTYVPVATLDQLTKSFQP